MPLLQRFRPLSRHPRESGYLDPQMTIAPVFVYVLASRKGGTLYIGVTSDLARRVWEHGTKAVSGFSRRYNVSRPVYFEAFDDAENAIRREKQMKKWRRAWKIELIEKDNPDWRDLYGDVLA